MAETVSTGWEERTPGKCGICGFEDGWQCDGRGNVLCDCQACPDCGIVDAYNMHEPGCPVLDRCEACGLSVPLCICESVEDEQG